MLTIYEQIQQSVDCIEDSLFEGVTTETAAHAACMSVRSFHRYFPAVTGYRFAEYVRKRRLSAALDRLTGSDDSVLRIAVTTGYDSHESFTRAFKREFGVAPLVFRTDRRSAARTERLNLVGEVVMGVLTKSLPDMQVVYFDGFAPDPEWNAIQEMHAWLEQHQEVASSYRTFGHNIDRAGRLSHDPVNEGYRVMVTVPAELSLGPDDRIGTIAAGEFVVTGIEGSFDDDPSGAWITEGWKRLQVMVERQGLRVHPSGRWYEEVLEPTEPGKTRFDLYLEVA